MRAKVKLGIVVLLILSLPFLISTQAFAQDDTVEQIQVDVGKNRNQSTENQSRIQGLEADVADLQNQIDNLPSGSGGVTVFQLGNPRGQLVYRILRPTPDPSLYPCLDVDKAGSAAAWIDPRWFSPSGEIEIRLIATVGTATEAYLELCTNDILSPAVQGDLLTTQVFPVGNLTKDTGWLPFTGTEMLAFDLHLKALPHDSDPTRLIDAGLWFAYVLVRPASSE